MSARRIVLAGVLAVLALSVTAAQDPNAKAQFEKARFTMETRGDLEGAVRLFQEIIEGYPREQEIAALSQYHIGLCYERLGKAALEQALAAFQKVIDKYPGQADSVGLARAKLASLRPAPAVSAGDGIRIRQLDLPGQDFYSVTRDGRYLTYINWTSIELGVYDTQTRKSWELTNEGTWEGESSFPDRSIWSPDGTQIAYYWITGTRSELRVTDRDGTRHRLLLRGIRRDPASSAAPWPHVWTPDGRHLVATVERGAPGNPGLHTDQIVMVSVDDGSVRVVKESGARPHTHSRLSLSPDGRFIAYDSWVWDAEGLKGTGDIHILSADGRTESVLVRHPALDRFPLWLPDGSGIVFVSDRRGTPGLWMLKVVDGAARGEPELIKDNLEESFGPIGLTDDGTLLFATRAGGTDIFTADVDFDTGKGVSPTRQVALRMEGKNHKPVWSPNGTSLAYLRERSRSPEGGVYATLVIQDARSGEERTIDLPGMVGDTSGWLAPRWAADGRSVILPLSKHRAHKGIFRVDIARGAITPLVETERDARTPRSIGALPWLSRDGKTLYYLGPDQRSTVAFDLAARTTTERFRAEKEIYPVDASPDGRRVVFRYWHVDRNALWIVPADGGEPRELIRYQENAYLSPLCWTGNSRYLFVKIDEAPKPGVDGGAAAVQTKTADLCLVDVESGQTTCLTVSRDAFKGLAASPGNFSMHPDGKRLAFAGRTGGGGGYWALENFLPGRAPAK